MIAGASHPSHRSSSYKAFAPWLVLTLALIPWLVWERRKAFNHDIIWLFACAQRVLDGHSLIKAAYDTNPPLSIILYMPAVWLTRLTPLTPPDAVLILTFFLCCLCAVAVYRLTCELFNAELAVAATIGYVVAGTIVTMSDFGQRDHVTALLLVPFMLAQLTIRDGKKTPAGRWILLIAGSFGLLLKPPYVLAPIIIILVRALRRRHNILRTAFDADVMALTATAVIYIAIVSIFFKDYATRILPDVISLYLPQGSWMATVPQACLVGGFCVAGLLAAIGIAPISKPQTRLAVFLLAVALLELFGYVAQEHNFRYHLLPSLICFWVAIAIVVYTVVRDQLPAFLSAAIILAVTLPAAAYGIAWSTPTYPTGAQVEALPLTRLVAGCTSLAALPGRCPFLLFSSGLPGTQLTSYYAHQPSVSRFPSLWFIAQLIHNAQADRAARNEWAMARDDALFHKYAGYMAEDIHNGRPVIAIFCKQDFDYIGYFSQDQRFAAEWAHYQPDGSVSVSYAPYYPYLPASQFQWMNCIVYHRTA